MKSALKTNLVLAALLAVLAGGSYWYDYATKGAREKAEQDSTLLVVVPKDVDQEWMAFKDGPKKTSMKFVCEHDCRMNDPKASWKITEPLDFPADSASVNTIINSVFGATIVEKLDTNSQSQLAAFGLTAADPAAQSYIELKVKGQDQPYRVTIGKATPVGSNFYALLEGAARPAAKKGAPNAGDLPIRIVSGSVYYVLQHPDSYWRDKRIVQNDPRKINRVVLDGEQGKVELLKKDSQWFLASGEQADLRTADSYVTSVGYLEAHSFPGDEKEKTLAKLKIPAKPVARLKLFFEGKDAKTPAETVELLAYAKKTNDHNVTTYVALADRPQLFEVDQLGAEKFQRDNRYFKDHDLLRMDERKKIAKVVLHPKNGKAADFTAAVAAKALDTLSAIRVKDFVDQSKTPKATLKELALWDLLDKDGKKVKSFLFFKNTAGVDDYYVKTDSDWAELERHDVQNLPIDPEGVLRPTSAPSAAPLAKGLPPHFQKISSSKEVHGDND